MKSIVGILMLCLPMLVVAGGGVELDEMAVDVADKASLRRGASLYARYCQSCHSLKHMRYSRLAEDIGLSEDETKQQIIVGSRSIHDSMTTAMESVEASQWFVGISPPDLSLIARSRGSDWLYSYLRGFYLDESRPFGVNNTVYKDVAMPNVFWDLQGDQKAVFIQQDGQQKFERFISNSRGKMTQLEFDATIRDLVNFLVYVGEPAQLQRVSMGKYVLLFLFMFLNIVYLLKKEYWKDVH